MKATLEFSLPEESHDHSYALHGLDALLLISDLESEIRSKLRYDSGFFKEFVTEDYTDEEQELGGACGFKKINVNGHDPTLERVWQWIIEQKRIRQLPELV